MTNSQGGHHRQQLQQIAHRVMLERGLSPDFSDRALSELAAIRGPAQTAGPGARDLRGLLWCSIDNDDSNDLDQLTAAEALPSGGVRALVAVADVDSLVHRGSALDEHARSNTTSVYAAGIIFPMLPERLSTDLTSLGQGMDRASTVVDMTFGPDGALGNSTIYPAMVRNVSKLAYNSVAAWLEGTGPMPGPLGSVPGLAEAVRVQDNLAQRLKARRHRQGALDFETAEAHSVFDGDILRDLAPDPRNRAKDLIEELMIAANSATASFLASRGFPALRRVVRIPKYWDRIVELAADKGSSLPSEPDAPALQRFLVAARKSDPVGFPDLSLCVIKLMGHGEYVLETSQEAGIGHFGLAVRRYAHSTAPNRRYPDLITERLLKAALSGTRPPYRNDELGALAEHCTEREDAAQKVERQVGKSAAALLLESQGGRRFSAIVTGVTDGGTWVRLEHPLVEGKLVDGFLGRKVGDRLQVELVHTDVERGHIDLKAAG